MKKVYFSLFLFLLFLCPFVSAYQIDPSKLTYVETESNYSGLNLKNIGGDGYLVSDGFRWKVDMYLPEESFVYAQPVSKLVFRIRDATQPFTVPENAIFEGMENFPVNGGFRSVSGVKDLDVVFYNPMWSIGGNNIASPPHRTTIGINGKRYPVITIHVPERFTVMKAGDGYRPKNTYKLDEHTFLFTDTEAPAVVYYDPVLKDVVGKGVFIIFIIAVILLFGLSKYIPSFSFKSKHIFVALLLVFLLSFQFAQLIPFDQKVVVQFHNSKLNIATEKNVFRTFPTYLLNTLSLSKSFDYAIAGNYYECGYKEYFLASRSVEKFFIIKGYEDYRCNKFLVENFNSSKIQVATVEEIEKELAKTSDFRHPFRQLFVLNAKLITLLSCIMFSLLTAFLILYTCEKKWTEIWKIAIVGFVLYQVMMFFYTLIGYVVRMPVSYHGSHPFDMTLTTFFMPDVVLGGNTLRLLFCIAGVFLLMFSNVFRRKINVALFLLPFLFFILLLALPQTEFVAKREIITLMSGEGFIYDQKVGNAFSIEQIYTAARTGNSETIKAYLCSRDDLQDSLSQKIFFCESPKGGTSNET